MAQETNLTERLENFFSTSENISVQSVSISIITIIKLQKYHI